MVVIASAPATRVWRALTDPGELARWFGVVTPSLPLRTGQPARLEFGDGDFFSLQDVFLEPPGLVQYAWRFLGIGPLDLVTWRIAPDGACGVVTVTDREPGRSLEAAQLLRQGWIDFTGRLQRYLSTGAPTRYDWRREVDGSIELPLEPDVAWRQLFSAPQIRRWLPIAQPALVDGAMVELRDGHSPTHLLTQAVRWQSPTRVEFELTEPSWLTPTTCELELNAHRAGTLLSVRHLGWGSIAPDPREQVAQRRRFTQFWIAALKRACDLCARRADQND
jgi:uncharacterized protein YndB with AHSA1/START domain